MSRVALFEVILAQVQTVYHIPPRLVLTLMSESWRAPLVSSCVAKAIPGKEQRTRGRELRPRCRGGRPLLHRFSFLSILQKQDATREGERERKHWVWKVQPFFSVFSHLDVVANRKIRPSGGCENTVPPFDSYWLKGSLWESILFN